MLRDGIGGNFDWACADADNEIQDFLIGTPENLIELINRAEDVALDHEYNGCLTELLTENTYLKEKLQENLECIGFVDSEGIPHLSRDVKGGWLYWGDAPKHDISNKVVK